MDSSTGDHRCKGRNKHGEPCAATIVGADGYCPAHAGGGRDMKAVGRLGGRGRSGPRLAAGIPRSLREALRELPAEAVVEAVRESLVGSNAAAKVAAVRLLSDLEAFRHDADESKPDLKRIKQARIELDGLLHQVAGHDAQLAADVRQAVETIGSGGHLFHEHSLSQAREVFAELEAIGVLARAPHIELEPPAA